MTGFSYSKRKLKIGIASMVLRSRDFLCEVNFVGFRIVTMTGFVEKFAEIRPERVHLFGPPERPLVVDHDGTIRPERGP